MVSIGVEIAQWTDVRLKCVPRLERWLMSHLEMSVKEVNTRARNDIYFRNDTYSLLSILDLLNTSMGLSDVGNLV